MNYGLTSEGLRIKRFADVRLELRTALRASLGAELDVDPETSIIGQLIDSFAEREATLGELTKGVYDAFYPSGADGVQLDNVCELTAIGRLPATKSVVPVKCGGTVGTVLSTGRIVSVENTGARFVSTVAAEIGASGFVVVAFEAEQAGAIQAPAGSLKIIETPVTGWQTAVNEEDAIVGRNIETDAELRERRLNSLQVVGAATVDAIRSRILNDVAGVTDAFVYENDSDVVDGGGRPPHSVQVIVAGGVDQDIGDKIWEIKAAGIQTYGLDVEVVVQDSMGFFHSVFFDRAEIRRAFMHIRIGVGTEFDQGVKQKEKITVSDNNPGDSLTVTINGRDFIATAGASAIASAAAIAAAITGDWVPTDVLYTGGNDYLELRSSYLGNAFTLTTASDGDTVLTVEEIDQNTGDQVDVVERVIAFAMGSEILPKEQTIGKDVYRSRYFTPINTTPDIETIEIFTADGLEDVDYWPTSPPTPPPSGDWSGADIAVAADEVVDLETRFVTVEII